MQRLKTREVRVGSIKIGGSNPIRIQSMTNTDTLDVEKTAEQIMLLRDNGCDIVRVAVLGRAHALACGDIKNFLLKHGYDVPLVADIHFFPQSALDVCDFVEKIRINPGNYIVGDKPSEVIESELAPLIEKCKKQKKVLRIGVNHGSLSDRILYYYGNTPQGMVVSALEYGAICEKYGFYDIVYSMKASDPVVMLEAYRYLVDQMVKKGNIYPLHLGVTEAGMGDDARVKSAAGIGALLLNGIGDTIRISLTENPENEIPPAKNLVALSEKYNSFSEEFTLWNKTEQKSFFYSNEESKINNKCILTDIDEKNLKKIKSTPADFIFFSPTDNRIIKTRILHAHLLKQDKKKSLIACFSYEGDYEKIIIEASAELGILLLDNIIDGIHFNIPLTAAKEKSSARKPETASKPANKIKIILKLFINFIIPVDINKRYTKGQIIKA